MPALSVRNSACTFGTGASRRQDGFSIP